MKLGLTKKQALKIAKTALYIGASAILGYLTTLTTDNPQAFGEATIIINMILVTLKQFVTTENE